MAHIDKYTTSMVEPLIRASTPMKQPSIKQLSTYWSSLYYPVPTELLKVMYLCNAIALTDIVPYFLPNYMQEKLEEMVGLKQLDPDSKKLVLSMDIKGLKQRLYDSMNTTLLLKHDVTRFVTTALSCIPPVPGPFIQSNIINTLDIDSMIGLGLWKFIKNIRFRHKKKHVDNPTFGKFQTFTSDYGVGGISEEDGKLRICTKTDRVLPPQYMVVGYKTANTMDMKGTVLITLLIPKGAMTNIEGSPNTKCRTNRAIVVSILPIKNGVIVGQPLDRARAFHDNSFIYQREHEHHIKDFDKSRALCGRGIHFFLKPLPACNYCVSCNVRDSAVVDRYLDSYLSSVPVQP